MNGQNMIHWDIITKNSVQVQTAKHILMLKLFLCLFCLWGGGCGNCGGPIYIKATVCLGRAMLFTVYLLKTASETVI